MKRLKILVDMDSTINNFVPHLVTALRNAGYGFDMQGYQNHGTWHIEDFIEGADDPSKALDSVMKQVEMWATVPPLKDAPEILQEINRFHDVTIATVPWGTSIEMQKVKLDWLAQYFPFIKPSQVSFATEKWTLEGDVIFDDKPDTIERCGAKMITVVPDQPYNRDTDCDFRFKTWTQVPKIMKVITRYFDRGGV